MGLGLDHLWRWATCGGVREGLGLGLGLGLGCGEAYVVEEAGGA